MNLHQRRRQALLDFHLPDKSSCNHSATVLVVITQTERTVRILAIAIGFISKCPSTLRPRWSRTSNRCHEEARVWRAPGVSILTPTKVCGNRRTRTHHRLSFPATMPPTLTTDILHQQTPNSKQFKPTKDILLNSSRNLGKPGADRRAMNFSSSRSSIERTTVNGEQLRSFN
jgi:hypothetical protein